MEQTKNERLMACTNLDELINVEYGEPGTESRRQFDEETQAFCLAQTLKEEHQESSYAKKARDDTKCRLRFSSNTWSAR